MPSCGLLVIVLRSATAWDDNLAQKLSIGTGSSGRSKRHSQYRVTGAFEAAEIVCADWTTFPAGTVTAAGQDQRGKLAPWFCRTRAAQPARGSEGGQLVQGR